MNLAVRGRKLKSKFLERYFPYILFVLFLSSAIIPPTSRLIDNQLHALANSISIFNLVTVILTIESILFGFLLTVLALTLQISNKAIDLIKKADRFNELIRYNRSAVYSCFAATFIGLVLILFPQIPSTSICYVFWFGVSLLSFFLSIRYVRLFFKILLSP